MTRFRGFGRLVFTLLAAVLPGMTIATDAPSASALGPEVSGISAPDGPKASAAPQLTIADGQSATLLPDGRWLLVGGVTHPGQVEIEDPAQAGQQVLPVRLAEARSGHTATVLPDGTVLILGGVAVDGWPVSVAEQFDPSNSSLQLLGDVGLQPRAFHTATLLSDGRVLIAGGVGSDGQILSDVEIYDAGSHQVELLPAALDTPRVRATASLTDTGSVLIWRGTNARGEPIANGVLFDPDTEKFAPIEQDATNNLLQSIAGSSAPAVSFTNPRAGASDASISAPLVVRFNKQLAVDSLNPGTVTLIGPSGATATKVTPADNGVLLFVTPAQDLMPAQAYTLFISGATDGSHPLPFTAIGFATGSLNGGAGSTLAAGAVPSDQGGGASQQVHLLGGATSGSVPPPGTAEQLHPSPSAQTAKANSGNSGSRASGRTNSTDRSAETSAVTKQASSGAVAVIGERWVPGSENYNGRWRSGHKGLATQAMPQNDILKRALYGNPEIIALMGKLTPAKVAAGALRDLVPHDVLYGPRDLTAVTGQVLKLNGQPLRGVTLSMGSRSTITDLNGEFLLRDVPIGHQILVIDGSAASLAKTQYGRYEYGMNVVAGQTNALPFVIWMTALDVEHATTIAAPTPGPTVLTNPEIPGLELRIPAGSVIRDAAGNIVTKISITAIPTDQPPFPLPDVPVPTYFTIQPGGAHLESAGGQVSPGAQLIYPNFTRSKPGTRITFWNYDPLAKGWYVYGQGTVTPDGSQVMPDPGAVIYEFSGAMVALTGAGPATGPLVGGCKQADPVDCFTGLFVNDEVDLRIADVIPIEVRRTYRQSDSASRAFGIGTNLSYDIFNVGTSNATSSSGYAYTYQDLILPDGGRIHYPRISQGTSANDAVYQNTTTPGRFYGSIIQWAGSSGYTWTLTLKDGTRIGFPDSDGSSNARAAAAAIFIDRNGNQVTLTRDWNYNLTQVTSPNGRHLNLTYDSSNRITQASDDIGRTVTYSYDTVGRLIQVTDPSGHAEQYSYDSNNNMTRVTDRRGYYKVTNTYDTNNRVSTQTYADGTASSFSYTLDSTGTTVLQTDFTDQRGTIHRMIFNASGYPTQLIDAVGRPEQQSVSYGRSATTNLVNSVTDALSRTTNYTYDALGNATQITWLAGTSNAVSAAAQYDPMFSMPLTATDPNNNTTRFTYDASGNLLQRVDPLSHATTFTYDVEGRLATVTDANGNSASFVYFGGDLTGIINALGNQTVLTPDAVGRIVQTTTPLGSQSSRSYNVLDWITSATDGNGAQIQFSYDANGNALSRTDANSHATTYSYDPLGRVQSATDPLLAVESYGYEPGGRPSQFTDRKGQVKGWGYDALGRPTQIGYGATVSSPSAYGSTIAQTWDAGDRLTQMMDSASGTITRTYDGMDRLTQETTPQGTVSYTYDAGGRRATMAVSGQPTVSYTWDVASRLTQLQQAAGVVNGNTAQTITFQYDNANRRTQMVLSNGITAAYTYDNANELTGITYTQSGGSLIGTLTYSYDAGGHRVSVGGTLANVLVPTSGTTAVYNVANRMTQLNGATLSYDSNGNTTNDGANGYAWNARNELSSITGSVGASFQYDGLGRRVQKSINGIATGYLYDGPNFVQEQNGSGSVTASLVTGGVDEIFARMTSAGASIPLTDALGSAIAEASTAQTLTTTFGYEPYGRTTLSGTTAGNTQQYAGRENDSTGLYYNRARYYSPSFARFMSEDPIRFAGGDNLYAYTAGNPISWRDPSGHGWEDAAFAAGNAAADAAFAGDDPASAAAAGFAGGWAPGPSPGAIMGGAAAGAISSPSDPGGGAGWGAAGAAVPFESQPGMGIIGVISQKTDEAIKGLTEALRKILCPGKGTP